MTEDLWTTLHAEAKSRGMILCYLQSTFKMMKRIHAFLPMEVCDRITCSTVDSAKGLEAEHVRLVYVPRHCGNREYDLGGLQRDPHRFYQASMRPTKSLKIFVPNKELQAHSRKRTWHGGLKHAQAADDFWKKFADSTMWKNSAWAVWNSGYGRLGS